MGDLINREFEKFQNELKKRDRKLKDIVRFETDTDIDAAIEELKNKELLFNESTGR